MDSEEGWEGHGITALGIGPARETWITRVAASQPEASSAGVDWQWVAKSGTGCLSSPRDAAVLPNPGGSATIWHDPNEESRLWNVGWNSEGGERAGRPRRP